MINIIIENPKLATTSTVIPFEQTKMDFAQATRMIEKALLDRSIVCDEIRLQVRI